MRQYSAALSGRPPTTSRFLFSFIRPIRVVAILSPLNSSVDIDRHPFFVLGERRVRPAPNYELTRSCGERGMFESSGLYSAAFVRYCSAETFDWPFP